VAFNDKVINLEFRSLSPHPNPLPVGEGKGSHSVILIELNEDLVQAYN